jgi:hypothetical protein
MQALLRGHPSRSGAQALVYHRAAFEKKRVWEAAAARVIKTVLFGLNRPCPGFWETSYTEYECAASKLNPYTKTGDVPLLGSNFMTLSNSSILSSDGLSPGALLSKFARNQPKDGIQRIH